MPIQVLGFDGNPFDFNSVWAGGDRFIEVILKLKFSGNYSTGGDALDLTNGGGSVAAPNTIPPGQSRGAATFDVEAHGPVGSWSSFGGYYQVVSPNGDSPLTAADLAAMKLKIFQAGGTELSSGAYPVGVSTPGSVPLDTVVIKLVYSR